MKVKTREQAWEEVNKIFPSDYEKDQSASVRAGYDIYRNRDFCYYNYICDLGCRLEVNIGKHGENAINIWIDSELPEPALKLKDFLKMVKEPVQVVVKKDGQCFEYACMSNSFHAEEAMERTVYEVSSTVVFGHDTKISVTVW